LGVQSVYKVAVVTFLCTRDADLQTNALTHIRAHTDTYTQTHRHRND